MSKVMLIVADSLRWDYASSLMWGEMFDESVWTRMRTHDTYTAACMPTLLSGSTSHKNTDFLRRLIPSDSLLQDRDSVMWSHTFGNEKSMLKFGEPGQFDIRGFDSNDENKILDWLDESESDELPELIVYHSLITHWPFGLEEDNDDIEFVDGVYIDDKRNFEWSHENYEKGVRSMVSRVRAIEELLPDEYTIVLTSDHGEGLGENGVMGHIEDIDTGVADWVHHPEKIEEEVSWSGVEKNCWTIEVPLAINDSDIELMNDMMLMDVRGVVENILDDESDHAIPHFYEEWDVEFLGDEYSDMGSVEEQLEALGYK